MSQTQQQTAFPPAATPSAATGEKPLRILILEDSITDARLVEGELRHAGITFKAVRVDTREDFSAEIERCGYDLILSDVHLPSFDGIEALTITRDKCPAIPFIFVTGTMGDEEAVETIKKGAMDYVLKDHLARLGPAVRRALQEVKERRERDAAHFALKESNEKLQAALNDLQRTQAMLIRNEKLAALGQLAAGVVHEIRNPLNIISTSVQLIQMEEVLSTEQSNICHRIMEQVNRLAKITGNLRDFARERKPEKAEFDLHGFLEKTVALVEYELKLDNVNFSRHFRPSPIYLKGDTDQLAQVFLNLITNAADSMKEKQTKEGWEALQNAGWKGLLTIATARDDSWVTIRFRDTGTGIPADLRQRIFDPFYTTKEDKGTGLGLPIAAGIIEDHGGSISVESAEGEGTTFTIRLPRGGA